MKTDSLINRDLILRENLAIERTDMAIDRTLLSFVRTALYFAIAGMTINSLLKLRYGLYIELAFWIKLCLFYQSDSINIIIKRENFGIAEGISAAIK